MDGCLDLFHRETYTYDTVFDLHLKIEGTTVAFESESPLNDRIYNCIQNNLSYNAENIPPSYIYEFTRTTVPPSLPQLLAPLTPASAAP